MKIASFLTAMAIVPASTLAFSSHVPKHKRSLMASTTARPALKDLNIESFLNKARLELERLINLKEPSKEDNKKQPQQYSYHKGGNARYQNPVVLPSKLSPDEECRETMIDFATGDELCWGESPSKQPPKNYNAASQSSLIAKSSNTAMQYHSLSKVRDDYHKGGNSHYQAQSPPRLLTGLEDECADENRFTDFATGDELCWAD
jgi:hypothetical protein